MKKLIFLALASALLTAACGTKQSEASSDIADDAISTHKNAPGDSARYGLACDGCTDSVLVFLPYQGGGLDTFDILDAFKQNRIYGRPLIGDELAVIVNPEDSSEALMVIDIEQLRGEWCYQVTPTLRNMENMPRRMQRRVKEELTDSMRKELMTPREYSLRLKRDHTASARGSMNRQKTSDDLSPIEYPAVRRYTEWHLFNGQLVLKADTIPGFTREGDKPEIDTVSILMLRQDTLILRFPTHEQSYYRKKKES